MANQKLLVPNTPITNFGPLLPGLLSLKGRAMSLDNHFVFKPLFEVGVPQITVCRASRQIGKSQQFCGRVVLQTAFKAGQETLVVLPLQEQSDRISSIVFKPMIEDSPISVAVRSGSSGSIRRRDFDNRSTIHFSYAFLDAERARGVSASWLYLDEAQDMDASFVPILLSCLDGAPEPALFISGTSKTKDTMLESSWNRSSQGIWQIKCSACGFDNICCLEPEGHLLAIIGPNREDISAKRPGIICKGCLAPISSRRGRWVHRYPEKQRDVMGMHIPQVIMPGHCESVVKWRMLLSKRDGGNGFTTAKFYNEVLGEAFDSAFKLVSIDDLKAAAVGIGKNEEATAIRRNQNYRPIVLGVDWGGGGDTGVSRTKVAAMGINGNGDLEVFFGAQFPPSTDRVEEGRQVLRIAQMCRAEIIAHDFNGVGTVSESVMTHLGWPEQRILPMVYRQVVGGRMLSAKVPGQDGGRRHYVMDKARTLQFLCMAIRQRRVRFFDYDYVDDFRPGLLYDFTTLVQDKLETPSGEVYRIRKANENVSDDFAHAVNYGAWALWEYTQTWPDLSVAGRVMPHSPGE